MENTDFLRHTVAALAYRAAKALRGAPEDFARFRAAEGSRAPVEILAHMGDLMDWVLHSAKGTPVWNNSAPLEWDLECQRFFAAVQAFDEYLAAAPELGFPAEKLFQGAIADALTHTGQLTYLRRLAEAPIRGESYFRAEITVGRVGEEQAAPAVEFD